jgi:hypothetical protein
MTDQNTMPSLQPPAPPPNALSTTPGAEQTPQPSVVADGGPLGRALISSLAATNKAVNTPAPSGKTVLMLSPTGDAGEVPEENVAAAIKAGGKVGTRMIAPDGSKGIIPVERVHDAFQAGATLDHPGGGAANLGEPEDISTGPEGTTPDDRLMSKESQADATKKGAMLAGALVAAPVAPFVAEAAGGGLLGATLGGGAAGSTQSVVQQITEGKNPFRAENLEDTAITTGEGAALGGVLHGVTQIPFVRRVFGMAPKAAPELGDVTEGHFTKMPDAPKPQHGTPVTVETPLDNATINNMSGGKDLSKDAVTTLKGYVGDKIPIGSTAKNTVMKAVEPVQKTLQETGLTMNKLIEDAPAFKTTIMQDGKFDEAIDAVRDNLPGGDEEKLNATIDKEIQNAQDVLRSTDPREVLAYRRKLGTTIDWNDVPRNPETTGEVQNVAKIKIYHALGDKIHTEIPETVTLDKIFQPNLELQSHLDAKLGRTVSRDPVEANAQQLSEHRKGLKVLETAEHNAMVDRNWAIVKRVLGALGVGGAATLGFEAHKLSQ